MSKTYVLYHGFAKDGKGIPGCFDGFGAAFAAFKRLGDSAEYIPVTYGQPPPPMAPGAAVFIVDFAYSREVLLELAGTHRSVTVLDHHVTAEQDLKDLAHPNLTLTFDMDRSGAAIAWDHFHPGTEVPWLIRFISDRDLMRLQLPGSTEMHTILQSHPFDFAEWQRILDRLETEEGRRALIQDGQAIVRFRDMQVERTCQQAALRVVQGHRVPICNATGAWSEVGLHLLALFPASLFAIAYFLRADGQVQLSIRSRAEFDCTLIAKAYGGGGHAQASGAVISTAQLQQILDAE
jgi:hypothetical protein